MKVVGCARRQERVDDLAKQLKEEQGRLYSRRCDVAAESDIREMFNWIEEHPDLGKVDVCINNAGLSAAETLMDGKVEDWRRMLDVNVLALCLATQLSIKSMTKHGIDDGQVTCSLLGFLGFTSETNFNILGGDGELLLRSQGASKPLNQVSLCFVFNPVLPRQGPRLTLGSKLVGEPDYYYHDRVDFLIDAITYLAPPWLVSLPVTQARVKY